MNEYAGEVNFFLTNKQMRPFEYLDSIGALDGDFIAAHCLLLSEHEKELLAEREVKVCTARSATAAKVRRIRRLYRLAGSAWDWGRTGRPTGA